MKFNTIYLVITITFTILLESLNKGSGVGFFVFMLITYPINYLIYLSYNKNNKKEISDRYCYIDYTKEFYEEDNIKCCDREREHKNQIVKTAIIAFIIGKFF